MPEYLQQIWSELCAAHATLCQYNRVMSVSLHTERRLRGQSIEPTLELEHAPTPSFDRQDNPSLVTQFLAGYTDGNPVAEAGSAVKLLHPKL